jgi:hypothetical protein
MLKMARIHGIERGGDSTVIALAAQSWQADTG